jgi:hypothetical protein
MFYGDGALLCVDYGAARTSLSTCQNSENCTPKIQTLKIILKKKHAIEKHLISVFLKTSLHKSRFIL